MLLDTHKPTSSQYKSPHKSIDQQYFDIMLFVLLYILFLCSPRLPSPLLLVSPTVPFFDGRPLISLLLFLFLFFFLFYVISLPPSLFSFSFPPRFTCYSRLTVDCFEKEDSRTPRNSSNSRNSRNSRNPRDSRDSRDSAYFTCFEDFKRFEI